MKADPQALDQLRVLADEAEHNYITAACNYNLLRAAVIFKRVRSTRESQIVGFRGARFFVPPAGDGSDAA